MNRIKENVLYLLVVAITLFTYSCEQEDYSGLLENENQNVVGEIQSLEIMSGANMVLMTGWVEDENISEVRVSWDNSESSLSIPVDASNGPDTIRQTINDLEERLYIFDVETLDQSGNSSGSVSAGVEVFGSNYASNIINRELLSSVLIDNDLEVTYSPTSNSSGIVGTEFLYDNIEGERTEVYLSAESNSISVSDFPDGATFSYRSLFVPSPVSLDTIYTDYNEFTVDALPKIVFVTDDSNDDEQIEWLRDQDFYVTTYYNASFGTASEDDLNMLNEADLIIIGRSGSSGDFADEQKVAWNALTAPLILNTQWAARSSRLNWFDHSENPVTYASDSVDVFNIQVQDPGDLAFSDAPIQDNNLLPWLQVPINLLYVNTPPNGKVLATGAPGEADREEGGAMLFVRFEPGTEFYDGAGESSAGSRTYFGFGADVDGSSYYFPLTDQARQVYLNEINRMLAL